MVDGVRTFVVSTEESAWAALKEVLSDKRLENVHVDFSKADWAKVSLNFKGTAFNQTVTPSIMRGMVEYQNCLLRSSARLLRDSPDIRRLTDEEKTALELIFQVNKGSSDLQADAKDILQKMAEQMVGKLSGRQIVIITLGIALFYFGSGGVAEYVKSSHELQKSKAQIEADVKKSEIASTGHTAALSTISGIIDSNNKTLSNVAEVMKRSSTLREINAESQSGYGSIIRHSDRAESVNVQGIFLSSEDIKELTQSHRSKSEQLSIKDRFIVRTMERIELDKFKLTVESLSDYGTITVMFIDPVIVEKFSKTVTYSLLTKKPITLTIRARRVGDNITDAKLLKAARVRG